MGHRYENPFVRSLLQPCLKCCPGSVDGLASIIALPGRIDGFYCLTGPTIRFTEEIEKVASAPVSLISTKISLEEHHR